MVFLWLLIFSFILLITWLIFSKENTGDKVMRYFFCFIIIYGLISLLILVYIADNNNQDYCRILYKSNISGGVLVGDEIEINIENFNVIVPTKDGTYLSVNLSLSEKKTIADRYNKELNGMIEKKNNIYFGFFVTDPRKEMKFIKLIENEEKLEGR